MGYATLQPRRIKSLCLEKSASRDFFTKAVILSLGNPSDPLKRQLEIDHTSTKTASGVRIKNYLDHVYAVSDKDGDIKEHYRYTAFGEAEIYNTLGQKLAESAIDNDVLWNSRRFDGDTGLYYYKYRHYAAKLGRWLGRDPIEEEGGINLYGFVGNDVVNRWDRLGENNADCAKCVELKTEAENNQSRWMKKLKRRRSNKGCTFKISCACSLGSRYPTTTKAVHHRATLNGNKHSRITLKCSSNINPYVVKKYVRHELIHALDYCEGNDLNIPHILTSCQKRACREVRAYKHSKHCGIFGRKNCVAKAVLGSMSVCPNTKVDDVKLAMKHCYKLPL